MKKRLTDRFVESVAPPASGRAVYIDDTAPGLELRVSADGRKAWSIRYKPRGGERKRETHGTYPAVSLAAARERARDIGAAATKGIDLPTAERREREEQRKSDNRPRRVGDLLDEYVERYCKPNQRKWTLAARIFDSHVKPAIGKKPLGELRRADIVELLDDLQNKKGLRAQVNRVRSQVLAALNWGIEREYLDTNPAAAIKKCKIEASRDRVLTNDELQAIWRAADGLPLVPTMVELLDGLRRCGLPVFTIDGTKPYAGQKRLKAILDRESGVTGWTLHDFRRTASTGMAALHVPQDTIDRVLNHAKGTLAGTYNRHQYANEKRRALEAWAERVTFIVGDAREAVNVVELRVSA